MDRKPEHSKVGLLFTSLAENTTLHGVPNAHRATSIFRKVFWSALFVTALAMMIYQMYFNFDRYLAHPTSTSVEIIREFKLEFPAVTVCNKNMWRMSQMKDPPEEFVNLLDDNTTTILWEYNNNIHVNEMFHLLSDKTRKEIGHDINDMLIDCFFYKGFCTPEQFSYYFDSVSGNCYTFNGGIPVEHVALNSGTAYGLKMWINVEQYDYLGTFAAGITVTIHNQSYAMFPDRQGFTASPGYSTVLGIVRHEHILAKPPYGDCADISTEENVRLNAYENTDYTYQACLDTCYQQNVMTACGCASLNYPTSGPAFNTPNDTAAQFCGSQNQYACEGAMFVDFREGKLNCSLQEVCPLRCHEVTYQTRASFATWPSTGAVDYVFEYATSDGLLRNQTQDYNLDQRRSWVKDNILELMIYFESFQYEVVTTEAAYTGISMISDMGGLFGLWLGLSIITIFELVELVWDLLCLICVATSGCNRKKTSKNTIGANGDASLQPQCLSVISI